MAKEKRILSYFIGWLIIGLCILFVGVNNVFAATYNTNYNWEIRYYDNSGSSATAVGSSWNESLQTYISNNITTAAGSYGAGVAFSSPIPLIQNHTYTLSLYFPDRNNISLSSKSVLLLGSNLDDAKNKYVNEIWTAETIQSKVLNNSIIQFVFKANYSLNYIFLPWTTTNNATQNYFFTQVIMEDLGSEGVSINDINSSLSSQTNELNNSIQNSTNEIKGEIDDMEQSIIDNQNSNTDKEIESQKICDFIDKANIKDDGKFLNSSGILGNYADAGITDYININGAEVITLTNVSSGAGIHLCYYNVNKELISCINSSTKINEPLDLPKNAYYMRATILKTYNVPTYKICKNGNQGLNDKIDGLQGAITDSSAPNTSGLENSAGWLPAGPLDSILNLPLTMLNSLTNSLGKTCTPLNLTLPYVNKNIQIPCLSAIFAKITGVNGLWTWVGTIASVLILYNYLLNLYSWVDRILTLRAEFDEAMGADLANWGRL